MQAGAVDEGHTVEVDHELARGGERIEARSRLLDGELVDLTLEPRVGGTVRFDIDDLGTRVLITGRFLAIDRPHLLRFTWSESDWPDPTAVSVVNVAFEPLGDDQTLMTIEHSLLPPDVFDEYQSGWADVCDQLAAFLHGRL